jgi:hypothetical protein
MDAGVIYKDGIEKKTPVEIKTRTTAMVRHFHTAGVWDSDTNAQIETTNYDNGTNLTAITANRWVKGLFIFMNGKIGFVYPTEFFVKEAEALDATLPTMPTGLTPVPKLSAIVYQQGDTDFTNATWQDVRAGIGETEFGTVTDHGSMAGLTDDDHPHYVLSDAESTNITNGTFNLTTTGNLNIGRLGVNTDPSVQIHTVSTGLNRTWFIGGADAGEYSVMLFGEGLVLGEYAEFIRYCNATAANPGKFIVQNISHDICFTTTYPGYYAPEFYIKNGGDVGIGFDTPLAKLAVNGGLHVGAASDPGDNNLLVDGTATITGTLTAGTIDATTEAGIEAVIDLQDCQGAVVDAQVPDNITVDLAATVTTNANLTGEVTSVGNATTIADSVAVTNWNLTTPTISTINLTGGQIAFPASQNASAGANTLDDYEEGTYTITITASTSGTVTLNSSYDTGAYVKIGRYVHVQGYIFIDSVSSPVGYARVSLPFVAANLAERSGFTSGSFVVSGVDYTATGFLCPDINEGNTFFYLRGVGDNAAAILETADIFSANDWTQFQVSYITN